MSFDRNFLGMEGSTALLEHRVMLAAWEVTKTATTKAQSYSVTAGNKMLDMNLWSFNTAGPGASLTMSHNRANPTKAWAVDFKAPNPTSMWTVKSYSHAKQGWTWGQKFTPNSGFPIKYSPAISKNVSFSFSADPANKVAYNAMVAAYGHHQPGGAKDPNGGANWEIMIWGDYSGAPKGQLVTVGGKEYYLEVNRKEGEKFTNWVYRAKNKTRSMNVNVGDFMRHAQVNKRADGVVRDTWLSSVTAGFELYNGTGKFNVSNFSVS